MFCICVNWAYPSQYDKRLAVNIIKIPEIYSCRPRISAFDRAITVNDTIYIAVDQNSVGGLGQ